MVSTLVQGLIYTTVVVGSIEVADVDQSCAQLLKYGDGCDWLELSRLVETPKLDKKNSMSRSPTESDKADHRTDIGEVVLAEEVFCIPLGKCNLKCSGWIRMNRDGEFSDDENSKYGEDAK